MQVVKANVLDRIERERRKKSGLHREIEKERERERAIERERERERERAIERYRQGREGGE